MARNVRYIGVADDPTGVNPQPQFYLDANEVGLDSPTETEMERESTLGMTNSAKAPGPYIPTGNFVFDSDIGSIGYFLKKLLNGYAFTAGPPVSATDPTLTDFHTHEIWANDQRDFEEFCTRVGKDEFEHVFEGCVATSLEVSVERAFVPFTVNINARRDFPAAALKDLETDIIPGLPPEFALPYHRVNLFIDEDGVGTAVNVSDIAMSLSMGIDNNTDTERGVTLGSRYSRRHRSSGRGFSLGAELDFINTAMKEKFWGDVNGPSPSGAKYFPVKVHLDAGTVFANTGTDFGECEITFPRCYFSTVPLSYSGRDPMSQGVEIVVQGGGTVTLADGTTQVSTPMYVRLRNRRGDLTVV